MFERYLQNSSRDCGFSLSVSPRHDNKLPAGTAASPNGHEGCFAAAVTENKYQPGASKRAAGHLRETEKSDEVTMKNNTGGHRGFLRFGKANGENLNGKNKKGRA